MDYKGQDFNLDYIIGSSDTYKDIQGLADVLHKCNIIDTIARTKIINYCDMRIKCNDNKANYTLDCMEGDSM